MEDEHNIVKTRSKIIKEVDALYKWLEENNVKYQYIGNLCYYVPNKDHALLMYLTWG